MKIAVVYHGGCNDGLFSLAVCQHALGKKHDVVPVYGKYGEVPAIPDDAEQCYFVDFSLPRQQMLDLAARFGTENLVVLDHHKTAEKELEGLVFAHFDNSESGATLTWKFFFGESGAPVPMLLQYVKDRDLWQHKLPNTQEINAYLQSLPKSPESTPAPDIWDKAEDIDMMRESGEIELKYRKQYSQKAAKYCHYRKMGDHIVPCTFMPMLESEICHEMLQAHPNFPLAVNFIVNADATIRVSIRGNGSIDCGVFAKTYGGGGHRDAAGCTFQSLTILDMLMPVVNSPVSPSDSK